jgi:hydrogenase nickel incorporation protein HypB
MFRDNFHPIAAENRMILHNAGVFTVQVVGPSGSGKSTLIEAALAKMPQLGAAVLYSCPCPGCACDMSKQTPSIQHIPIHAASITAQHVQDALATLNLSYLDLLIIENTTSTAAPAEEDLGEDLRVGVLSVVAGDDKALQHTSLVRHSDALVLTKTDLLPHVRFDVDRFRADALNLHPGIELLEVSSVNPKDVDRWVDWLTRRAESVPETFTIASSELFFG